MTEKKSITNQVIEAIKTRRSVRRYEEKQIPRGILKTLIEAGNMAPSGGNRQPWRFVVVINPEFRRKLRQVALPKYEKAFKNMSSPILRKIYDQVQDPVYYSAPVILFVIGTGRGSANDCPMVCQNIMLAAHSLGIGSCWVGFGMLGIDDEVIEALELKDDEKIFGPILLGYKKDPPVITVDKKGPVVKWI